MTGIVQESLRNAVVMILSFFFGAIIILVILYLIYKFVLVHMDFRAIIIDSFKRMIS